jgi:hypothetical protein
MSLVWTTGRYYWDFSVNGLADVNTIGATGAAITQQADGISIVQTASSDVKAQLKAQRASGYNSTITADITCVSGSGNIGFCWRTTSFNTANDSYSWYFGITVSGWTLGTGSNSTYANWTQRASGSGTYTGRHTLKVVLNGTVITCYIDGVQVYTGNLNYFNNYGYVCPRAYMGDNTDRVHNLEILDTSIPDPTSKNINRYIKIVFDRDVHFPYADMSNYASAFTASFQQRDFYGEGLYTKTITATDIKHLKDTNGADVLSTVLVVFSLDSNFRKAENDITVHFDSSKCLIYGKYIKDKLGTFNLTFAPNNLDMWQNPKTIESLHVAPGSTGTIVSTPIWTYVEQDKTSAIHTTVATNNNVVPTLTGTIKL